MSKLLEINDLSVTFGQGENAVEAVEEGGDISVTLTEAIINEPHRTTTSVIAPGTYGHIQIKDTGVGISGAHRDKIFEPFLPPRVEISVAD